MTFDQIKQTIKGYVNLTSTEADTRVGEAINRHYQRITASLGLDVTRFVTRSESMTPGVRTVTFTQIEKIDRIIDTTDSTSLNTLREASVNNLRTMQPTTGAPTMWAPMNVTSNSVTAVFDTIPQSAFSLQADGWATQTYLEGNDEPAFAESYHDILTWAVLAEELLKKEKEKLALTYESKADRLLAELRHWIADSHSRYDVARSGMSSSLLSGGGAGGGSGSLGATAYTQSALITFDLGAGIAPFAVAQSNAPTITNLDADQLDGEDGSFYLNRANHTGPVATVTPEDITTVTTDRIVGRDSAGTGNGEQLSLTNGLEFTGLGSIGIGNDAITYARMQNVTAASRLLGRGASAGAGDPEEIQAGAGLTFTGAVLSNTQAASQTANTVLAGPTTGGAAAPTFRALVAADIPAGYASVLDRDVSATDVVTTAAETTVYSFSVPGGTLGSTKQLRLSMIGDYLNNSSGSASLNVRVKYGATTIAILGPNSRSNTALRLPFTMQTMLSALNSTSTQVASTRMINSNADGVTGNASNSSTFEQVAVYAAVPEDSTAAKTLAITVEHGTSDAQISFRCHSVVLELLN